MPKGPNPLPCVSLKKMGAEKKISPTDPLICFCNSILKSKIIEAITHQNADTLDSVYEKTGAGVGPCGGTCKIRIQSLIRENIEDKTRNDQNSKNPSQPSWEPPLEFVEAISLFNRRYYWETHEVLEKLWLEEHGPLKILYQGIIQASAALYHVLNANPKGALKLTIEARKKLLSLNQPVYGGSVEIEPLCRSLEQIEENSRQILSNPASAAYNYDKLPQIRLLFDPISDKT